MTSTPSGTGFAPDKSSSLTALSDVGRPAVPFRVLQVLIPNGQSVIGVTATATKNEIVASEITPALAIEPVGEAPRAPATAPTVHLAPEDGGDEYPASLVRYLGTGTWHGYSVANIAVFPVRMIGTTAVLHPEIDIEIALAADLQHASPSRVRRTTPRAERDISTMVRSRVENAAAMGSYPSPRVTELRGRFSPSGLPSEDGSPVEYLIVTTPALAPAFQVLADWKTSKGVPTQIRTVEWIAAHARQGSDIAETIRFFLQDAYENWGVRYVLLAGDTPEIPPRYLYSTYYYGGTSIPADTYFACLDGTFNADGDTRFGEQPADAPDLYPELVVGRVPVSTIADANTVVSKIIGYETPVAMDYTDKVLMLAEVIFPAPWSSGPIELNGGDIANYVYQSQIAAPSRRGVRLFETPWVYAGSLPESRAIAIDSLEAGYSNVFHVGHGFRFNMHCADDNISIPDADALTHPNRPFNLYMLNCTAAAFDYDCLAEHLLRNPAGGAVSVIGATGSAFALTAAYYMEDYAKETFKESARSIGDAFNASKVRRTPFAGSDNADLWTHYIYTLLGDPEMAAWTGPMRTASLVVPDTLAAGDNLIEAYVLSNGEPVEGATVCFHKSGEDYQVLETDATGAAWVSFASPTPGTIDVVVTGENLVRVSESIHVDGPSGPVVKIQDVTIDDDSLDGTSGNGNGVLDAGEIVDVFPHLTNFGIEPLSATGMQLLTASAHVTILDNDAAASGVEPGAVSVATDPWRIAVAATAPDAAVVSFTSTITDGSLFSDDSFERVLHAPAIEVVGLRKSDAAPVGNGDGVITPDEPFRLFVTIKNFGSGTARNLGVVLRSLGAGATVLDSLDTFADTPQLTSSENTIGFTLSESSVIAENPLEIVITDARGIELHHTFELRAPAPPTIESFNPGLGIDKMALTWAASPSPDARGYSVYRATAITGPFVRASLDIVGNTTFTDTGLSPSTRYFYAVTTVDDGGNESAYSAVGSASTTPPQLPGWPNTLADASANSPTIGDIDGDGDLDVVVGNDRMYAWQFDGHEVIDGDGQALSWGVLSPLGDDFIGPSALADFDGVPGLDIATAAYTSKQVFIMNASGQALPGWPRPTVDFVRASVAIGDIDGDTDFEVVAIDQDAYLYAWHADGTEVIDGDANPATHGVFRRLPDTNQLQYQSPALADIDADGKDEIIVCAQDKKLYVLNEVGADEPGWPRTLLNYPGGGIAVGDIDNNGDLEIVVTTRGSGETYALNHDNTVMWQRWLQCNLFFNPSPSLADLTGDGKLETLIAASNGRLYAVQYDGSDVPGWPVIYAPSSYTESSPVIADVSGDGLLDVILGDETKHIRAWDATGQPIDGFPLVLKDSLRGTPAVVDLDYDGDVEVVAVGYDKTVYVWDLAAPYDASLAPWPMFRANVHRNGLYASDTPTPVGDRLPRQLMLAQNYPNPFNPTTTIAFELPSSTRVSLVVYDVTGARVRTLVDDVLPAGHRRVAWDGRNDHRDPVGSGVYFYRLATGNASLTKKMVLLK